MTNSPKGEQRRRADADSALLGKRVRRVRRERELTIPEAAAQLQWSPKTIERLEQGFKTLSIQDIRHIAAWLDVDFHELVGSLPD